MKSLEDLFKEDITSLLENNGYLLDFSGVEKNKDGIVVTYRNRSTTSGKIDDASKTPHATKTISAATQKKYDLAHKELKDLLYVREDFNNLIAASLFWYPCIEEAHDLLLGTDLENFNYDAAIGYLADVAELMAEKIFSEGYSQQRYSVHKSTKEISDVRGSIKKDMNSVLALAGNAEKIDTLLNHCEEYFNARNAEKGGRAQRFKYATAQLFIMPLVNKIKEVKNGTAEEKLVSVMTYVPFINYLEKYKDKGTGY